MQKIIRSGDMDWKQWNLRIPLVLFLFGATAALYQSFPNLFLAENGFFVSVQYIGGIVLLFMSEVLLVICMTFLAGSFALMYAPWLDYLSTGDEALYSNILIILGLISLICMGFYWLLIARRTTNTTITKD